MIFIWKNLIRFLIIFSLTMAILTTIVDLIQPEAGIRSIVINFFAYIVGLIFLLIYIIFGIFYFIGIKDLAKFAGFNLEFSSDKLGALLFDSVFIFIIIIGKSIIVIFVVMPSYIINIFIVIPLDPIFSSFPVSNEIWNGLIIKDPAAIINVNVPGLKDLITSGDHDRLEVKVLTDLWEYTNPLDNKDKGLDINIWVNLKYIFTSLFSSTTTINPELFVEKDMGINFLVQTINVFNFFEPVNPTDIKDYSYGGFSGVLARLINPSRDSLTKVRNRAKLRK